MKILILTTVFPRKKGDYYGNWIQDLVNEFSKENIKSIIIAPHSPGIKTKENFKNINIKRFRYLPERFETLGYGRFLAHEWAKTKTHQVFLIITNFMKLIPYLFSMFFTTLFLVKKEKPDLLFAHFTFPCGLIGAIVSKLTKTKALLRIYGTDIVMLSKFKLKFLARKILDFYPKIASISNYTTNQAIKTGVKDPSKIFLIPEGLYTPKQISLSKIKAIKKQYGLKNEKIVFTVHRLIELKGTKYLIYAAAEVVKKYKNVKFIIGGEGPEKDNLKKLVKQLGLEKHVIIPGRLPVVEEYMALTDIYSITSLRDRYRNTEGLGMPVILATSFGKPSVGFAVGGPLDTIKDNHTGFLVKEKDYKTLAEKLLILLKNDKLRNKFGVNAKELFNKKFIWSRVYKKYKELVHSIV